MKIIKNTILQGSHNKPILIDYFYKQNNKLKPIIIFCHGYKGYKDWGSWNLIAAHFANQDFFFTKFNFSHNGGTVKQPIDFPDLDAFANNNYSIELDDLQVVINTVLTTNGFQNEIDKNNIILIGHSRGAGIITLKAVENNKISKIISWAGISDIEARFPKGDALKKWQKDDIGYVTNLRTKQQMPNKYQIYENFMANKERLHIQSAVERLEIPHLIIYGTNDQVVLPKEAKNLHKWNPKSKLLKIENMNHGLGNTQPWVKKNMPIHTQKVVEKTIEFITNLNLIK
ncbi:MAG: alpha/beta hydrolase [Flavobacteriaceae bacterium]|nr:alpha/beta hydrolase [Flavobacteriaceae bacterium]